MPTFFLCAALWGQRRNGAHTEDIPHASIVGSNPTSARWLNGRVVMARALRTLFIVALVPMLRMDGASGWTRNATTITAVLVSTSVTAVWSRIQARRVYFSLVLAIMSYNEHHIDCLVNAMISNNTKAFFAHLKCITNIDTVTSNSGRALSLLRFLPTSLHLRTP